MHRARRTATAVALVAGSVALSACAGSASGADGAGAELRIGVAYDTGGPGDEAFRAAAVDGAQAAAAGLGGELETRAPAPGDTDGGGVLAGLADAGFDPVIAVGFRDGQAIARVAADHPDTDFAVLDVPVAGSGVDNLTGLVFAEGEGGFLAGVAAAAKSVSQHVGVVVDGDGAQSAALEAGFVAGARAIDPAVVVDTRTLPPAGGPASDGAAARDMYAAGSDIVFAAGGSGQGVFQAAVETGQRAIGAGSDQYRGAPPEQQAVIMTSMVKHADVAVQAYVAGVVDGSLHPGVDLVSGVSTGGIGLSDSGGAISDIDGVLSEYRQRLTSGQIDVPVTP